MSKDLIQRYSPRYKETVFAIWYENERAGVTRLHGLVPVDEYDRKPPLAMLGKWMEDGEWNIRADILDEQASSSLDIKLVESRIEIFKKHAEIGHKLQEIGLAYFEEHELKNEAIALKAIIDGARLERESLGLGTALAKVFSMNDNELQKELQKLLNKSDKSDIVDGETEELEADGEETT